MAEGPDPGFGGVFAGRRVLVTGHTGFKGGWLCLWLQQLGARVTGLALAPEPGPSFFAACGLDQALDSRIADIRDPGALAEALAGADAEVLFHLAAQPLVRRSYQAPAATFETNAGGTAHVLDAALRMPSLQAAVVVSSDKCYENREWDWGYRESDPLGGHDPYSASKACTELVAGAYRNAFFAAPDGPQLATARAGNVFGGGDWGAERLVPDLARAAAADQPLQIRRPQAVRPWQHVLEPLSGYLALAARLLGPEGAEFAGAWNFGPPLAGTVTVRELTALFCAAWGAGAPKMDFSPAEDGPHEAGLLRLDSTRARLRLGWQPQLALPEAAAMTAEWYRAFQDGGTGMAALSRAQISRYSSLMAADADRTGIRRQPAAQ
ncbi:CDP-glucose 4,6-dehydratase [Leisingera sp. SS27]|uniref:CDP-glucose 4,6-dehydratase n=1 Tax=Leisingera sp. SS27 TaxID=2979462 RepID=UPI00232D4DAB|nr:CDP-glucose 4,6-dehydratase [Leisingera sp. SS27]MDC0660395.1 CDP-glucose 4,6-dehydratase [Leisingera sp. SS27]